MGERALALNRCIIIGGGNTVWDDIAEARKLGTYQAVIAVNDIGAEYPGHIDIWASLHPEKLPKWTADRHAKGFAPAGMYAAHNGNTNDGRLGRFQPDYKTDYRWPEMGSSGSSGLFAVKVALEQGYNRVVLCGVPMRAEAAHFFEARQWSEVKAFTEAWKLARHRYADNTRSMSGWTAEILGKPSKEWLAG